MAKMFLMSALVTIVAKPGEAIAPGNTFEVATEEEADRLVEIGAAVRVDAAPEPEASSGPAIGVVLISGEAGAVLPAGARLTVEGGPAYRTTDEVTIGDAGAASVPVMAEEAGSAGDQPAGAELQLADAPEGVDAMALVGEHGLVAP